ncbi:DUF3592 domain-containing protein [Marisediminicola antarctica]|uniref:DUF3592 domain-containing protein n=1 Tax=Marisediminicola antarctica TaxID=674079 RepID=A0A7L5AGC2_9MICO|nr:DUF3592 domain-containing protein [Marisediminicola antarctica]QHO69568.1 hypothetical protein BHD05_07860 [Marisediminicola antarctica]
MTTSDAFALVLELITWVGLLPGIVLLAAGYIRKAWASRYQETWGVIVQSPAGTDHLWFRWMDLQRELQSAPVSLDADESLELGDEVKVYFDPRNPENGRLDHPSADGRLMRILGWLLVGVGSAAAIVQIVILLSE